MVEINLHVLYTKNTKGAGNIMELSQRDWFIISFSQLNFNEADVKEFRTFWYKKRPETIHRLIAHILKNKYENTGLNAKGIYYSEHGALTEDGDAYPLNNSEEELLLDTQIMINGKEKIIPLQNKMTRYLEELDSSYKGSLKYNHKVLLMLNEKSKNFSYEIFTTNIEKAFEKIEPVHKEYPEYFSDPSDYMNFTVGDLSIVVPKPFGQLTEEVNASLQNIRFGISKIPTLGPDGVYFFTVEPQIETFEDEIYMELIDFQKTTKHPLRCEECGLFIENPTNYQYAIARKGKAVLHKSTDPEKLTAKQEGKRDRFSTMSTCELKYYRKRDQKAYEKKRKKNT